MSYITLTTFNCQIYSDFEVIKEKRLKKQQKISNSINTERLKLKLTKSQLPTTNTVM